MGEWIKGFKIIGGLLDGEIIPFASSFPGYNIGQNDYTPIIGTDLNDDINDNFIEVPFTAGQSDNDWVTLAIFQGNDTYPLNKVVLRIKRRFERAWGWNRMSTDLEIGYLNDQSTFVSMGNHGSNWNDGSQDAHSYPFKLYLHLVYDNSGPYIKFGAVLSTYSINNDNYCYGGLLDSRTYLQNYLPDASEAEEESPEFGKKSKAKGGYVWRKSGRKPTFNNHSDTITVSSKPTKSPVSCGFFHQYVITQAQMEYFADAMFAKPWEAISGMDLIAAVGELYQGIFMNKQMDFVLDLLIIPVTPSYGSPVTIQVGGRLLKTIVSDVEHFVQGNPVSDPFVDFPCGSITVPEYWANFLDFSGTKFKLFLPYVGYVDIQPEFINGGTLWVDYRFNTLDGSFMAFVHSTSTHSELTRSLIGQYAGVAAIHIPLQGQDYSNKISGLISAMGVVAAGAASGGVTAPAAVGASASLANTMVQKPGTTHGNGYNASSSYLSHRKPYLIVERQIAQFSEKYPNEVGLPYYVNDLIGNCKGLTVASKMHLDRVPATFEEKDMILELFKEGVIVDQYTS